MTTTNLPNVGIQRGNIKSVVGVEVDTLQVSLLTDTGVTLNGQLLSQAALQGLFDGARLVLTRSFSKDWQSASCGSLTLFNGRVAQITVSGSEIAMTINSDLEILNTQMPRNVYMASCRHTLFDGGCTLNASSFTSSGNTAAGSTTTQISSNLTQPDGYFALGIMMWTSGANNQIARSIKSYVAGNLTVIQPLPLAPSPGDTFTVSAGCDKQQSTCSSKFSNVLNFGGFPYIPTPETAY